MKKLVCALLCAIAMLTTSAGFAEETEVTADAVAVEVTDVTADEATEADTTDDSDTPILIAPPAVAEKMELTVTATITDTPLMKESEATLEILSLDGAVLDTKTMPIKRDTKTVVFTFSVPKFEIGTDFLARAKDGLHTVRYYDDILHTGAAFSFPTYYYKDANGNDAVSTDIAISINPLFDKSVNLYYNADFTNSDGARVINGNAMIPIIAVAKSIGFDARYDSEYNSVDVELDGKHMYFNVGTAYTTVFGTDTFAPESAVMIDGVVYVSLRTFADALGSALEVKDYGTHLDINMGESAMVKEYFERLPINKMNVSSRTEYMVWVSLHEYKTRLYKGYKNHWQPVLEATCGIGAPGTPTVTGSFEYNYKTRWDYGTYYVGPCLVFYRGYALHSVLLNQNGTEYDGRVGMQLSHGCIRLKKKDIDFIANTIPVGTRIYITP